MSLNECFMCTSRGTSITVSAPLTLWCTSAYSGLILSVLFCYKAHHFTAKAMSGSSGLSLGNGRSAVKLLLDVCTHKQIQRRFQYQESHSETTMLERCFIQAFSVTGVESCFTCQVCTLYNIHPSSCREKPSDVPSNLVLVCKCVYGYVVCQHALGHACLCLSSVLCRPHRNSL